MTSETRVNYFYIGNNGLLYFAQRNETKRNETKRGI